MLVRFVISFITTVTIHYSFFFSTPDSKHMFSTNPFLHSSFTFLPTDSNFFFVFLWHVGFNFGSFLSAH